MREVETTQNDTQTAIRRQKHGAATWVDVSQPSDQVFAALEHEYHLHPVHLAESVQHVQHIRVEREPHYLSFVLQMPYYQPTTDRIVTSQVGVFLGKDFLVTIHDGGASPVVDKLFSDCLSQPDTQRECFKHGTAYLLYTLISHMLGDIFDMTEAVSNELDSIEDIVFSNTGSDAQRIGRIRQKIVKLERIIGPKRFVLEDLAQQVEGFSETSVAKYYSSTVKSITKLWEVVEEARETVEIYKDADFITSTEQTNKTLAILTLVFTLTIPGTVIGALYGMNVPLPGGLVTGPWSFFGTYTTLGVVIIVSAVAAIGMYSYFKLKRWL